VVASPIDAEPDVAESVPGNSVGSGPVLAEAIESQAEAAETYHVEDVLQFLRSRSIAFCEKNPGLAKSLLDMPGLFMPDSDLEFCFQCERKFTIIHRRHHCRICGILFCSKCSALKITLPPCFRHGTAPVRVCEACYEFSRVRGTGCGNMDDTGILTPAVVHAAICHFKPVDHTAETRRARDTVREACRFFAFDFDAQPHKITRAAVKKAYMNKLRDAHPDTQHRSQNASETFGNTADPSIATVKAHFATVSDYLDEQESGGGTHGPDNITRALVTANTDVCTVCLRAFKGPKIVSRHHCRRCGQAVCTECSPDFRPLPEYGFTEPVRQCSACVEDPDRFSAFATRNTVLALTDQVYPKGCEFLGEVLPAVNVVANDVLSAQLRPNGLGPRAALMAAMAKKSENGESDATAAQMKAQAAQPPETVFMIKLWYASPSMASAVSVVPKPEDSGGNSNLVLPTPADVGVEDHQDTFCFEVERTLADFQWLVKQLIIAGHSPKRLPPLLDALQPPRHGSKNSAANLKFYATQAGALNTFVRALMCHPILRDDLWIWLFVGIRRSDLVAVQEVCAQSNAKKSKCKQVPVCDTTRLLLPPFEHYFNDVLHWVAFQIQKNMFQRVNNQLKHRLAAAADRCERSLYRSTARRDRRHMCRSAIDEIQAMKKRSEARLKACTEELHREQKRLQRQRQTPLLQWNDRTEDVHAHKLANDERREDRRSFEQLKAQFEACAEAWRQEKQELDNDQEEWNSHKDPWVPALHRWMLEKCQRAFPAVDESDAETMLMVSELQYANDFFHDESAAFFDKVRDEEASIENEIIRLQQDAEHEMTQMARALQQGEYETDRKSWREIINFSKADNDDDSDSKDGLSGVGWWRLEDDMFALCEETREQEMLLRVEKEKAIEKDLSSREEALRARIQQQLQRKVVRKTRAEDASHRAEICARWRDGLASLDKSIAGVTSRTEERIEISEDERLCQQNASPLILKFEGAEGRALDRRTDHATLEQCDVSVNQQISAVRSSKETLTRIDMTLRWERATHANDIRLNEEGNPRTVHESEKVSQVDPADKFHTQVLERRSVVDELLLQECKNLQSELSDLDEESPAIAVEQQDLDAELIATDKSLQSIRNALSLLSKEKAVDEAQETCRREKLEAFHNLLNVCQSGQNRQARAIDAAIGSVAAATDKVRLESKVCHEILNAHKARLDEYNDISRRLEVRIGQHQRCLQEQESAGPEHRLFHEGMPLMHKIWKEQKKLVERGLKDSHKQLGSLKKIQDKVLNAKDDPASPAASLALVQQAGALTIAHERPRCHAQLLERWQDYLDAKERAENDSALLTVHDNTFFAGFNTEVQRYRERDRRLDSSFQSLVGAGNLLSEEVQELETVLHEATGALSCAEGPAADVPMALLHSEEDLVRRQHALRQEKESRIDARFRHVERVRTWSHLSLPATAICVLPRLCSVILLACR